MIDVSWKIAHKLYKRGFNKFARFFELISMVISSHAVSAQIEIGENSKFYHHALGCVVLQSVCIGNNCKIFQNVTFGNSLSTKSNNSLPHSECCCVGDNCLIGAGAVLLGNIKIGNNVTVGANAVVTHDIPDNCIAKGVPARYEIKPNLEEK